MKSTIKKALCMFITFSFVCGILYPGVITLIGQIAFPYQANGSIIEVDGKKYGSALLGQYYDDESHMWGRIMNIDVSTFTDEDGNALMYAGPSNKTPASEEYEALIKERKDKIQAAHGSTKDVPVDLVTCSGSGLDPHISIAAANYQIERIAKANNMSEDEVQAIIDECTTGSFLGIFGEKTVNVLKVNLMIDGIL